MLVFAVLRVAHSGKDGSILPWQCRAGCLCMGVCAPGPCIGPVPAHFNGSPGAVFPMTVPLGGASQHLACEGCGRKANGTASERDGGADKPTRSLPTVANYCRDFGCVLGGRPGARNKHRRKLEPFHPECRVTRSRPAQVSHRILVSLSCTWEPRAFHLTMCQLWGGRGHTG